MAKKSIGSKMLVKKGAFVKEPDGFTTGVSARVKLKPYQLNEVAPHKEYEILKEAQAETEKTNPMNLIPDNALFADDNGDLVAGKQWKKKVKKACKAITTLSPQRKKEEKKFFKEQDKLIAEKNSNPALDEKTAARAKAMSEFESAFGFAIPEGFNFSKLVIGDKTYPEGMSKEQTKGKVVVNSKGEKIFTPEQFALLKTLGAKTYGEASAIPDTTVAQGITKVLLGIKGETPVDAPRANANKKWANTSEPEVLSPIRIRPKGIAEGLKNIDLPGLFPTEVKPKVSIDDYIMYANQKLYPVGGMRIAPFAVGQGEVTRKNYLRHALENYGINANKPEYDAQGNILFDKNNNIVYKPLTDTNIIDDVEVVTDRRDEEGNLVYPEADEKDMEKLLKLHEDNSVSNWIDQQNAKRDEYATLKAIQNHAGIFKYLTNVIGRSQGNNWPRVFPKEFESLVPNFDLGLLANTPRVLEQRLKEDHIERAKKAKGLTYDSTKFLNDQEDADIFEIWNAASEAVGYAPKALKKRAEKLAEERLDKEIQRSWNDNTNLAGLVGTSKNHIPFRLSSQLKTISDDTMSGFSTGEKFVPETALQNYQFFTPDKTFRDYFNAWTKQQSGQPLNKIEQALLNISSKDRYNAIASNLMSAGGSTNTNGIVADKLIPLTTSNSTFNSSVLHNALEGIAKSERKINPVATLESLLSRFDSHTQAKLKAEQKTAANEEALKVKAAKDKERAAVINTWLKNNPGKSTSDYFKEEALKQKELEKRKQEQTTSGRENKFSEDY